MVDQITLNPIIGLGDEPDDVDSSALFDPNSQGFTIAGQDADAVGQTVSVQVYSGTDTSGSPQFSHDLGPITSSDGSLQLQLLSA